MLNHRRFVRLFLFKFSVVYFYIVSISTSREEKYF